MAAVTNLYRLVWTGRLHSTESWSCSLHVDAPTGLNLAASNFLIPLAAWMTRAGSKISGQAKMDEIKFNQIDPATAKYVLPTSNTLTQDDAGTGATTASWPPQSTVVVSTRTALDRGRGHAGRFYPPTGAAGIIGTDGRISSADANSMATSAATLLTDINALVAVGAGRVVVFSKVGQSVETVTGVRVGRVVDTMRSRRTSLPEEPSFVVVGA